MTSRVASYVPQLWTTMSVVRRDDARAIGTVSHTYGVCGLAMVAAMGMSAHRPRAARWVCSGSSWLPALPRPCLAPAAVTSPTPGTADGHRVVTLDPMWDLPQDKLGDQDALSPAVTGQNQRG